ncbi:Hpt domain-containing protein [Chitinibacteraceae bacterium HSL-7]
MTDASITDRVQADLVRVNDYFARMEGEIGLDLRGDLLAAFTPMLVDTESRLPAALAENDLLKVSAIAHKLKGAAAQIEAQGLSGLCLTIERAGKAGDRDAVMQRVPELLHFVAQFGVALR